MDLNDVLGLLREDISEIKHAAIGETKEARRGSRWIGPDASLEAAEHVASGGRFASGDYTVSERPWQNKGGPGLARSLKALAEGSGPSGGYLVPVEYSEQILAQVRARVAVMKMGPTVIGVKKELDVTSASAGPTASYVAENALIPVSEPTFTQSVLVRPKTLACLIPVSNRLLRDATENPALDEFLVRDIAEVIALRQDLAFIEGPGTSNQPLGIKNQPGLTAGPDLGANGSVPTFDHLKQLLAGVRATNATFSRPGFVFHPRLLSTLERLKTSDGAYLADAGLLTFDAQGSGGRLLGYPFATSSQIPVNLVKGMSSDTSYIVFSSDWGEVIVGEETNGLLLTTSNEASYSTDGGTSWISSYQADQTLFRGLVAHDIGLRRPAFVSVMEGVRPLA